MQPLQLIKQSIRILLIDNQTVVRAAMRLLIESQPGLEVIADVGDRAESLIAASSEQPDIILFAINEDSDLEFVPELIAGANQARVVVLTSLRDPRVHQCAIRLGAIGVVAKDTQPKTLMRAIEKVHNGQIWLHGSMAPNVLAGFVHANQQADIEAAKIATLTRREREVIHLIGEGHKNKQIAAALFISEATVRHHLTSIFDKVGVTDRLELVVYAYRHSLAEIQR
jgi:two-component system nitrate/nitrite response regulator NarL